MTFFHMGVQAGRWTGMQTDKLSGINIQKVPAVVKLQSCFCPGWLEFLFPRQSLVAAAFKDKELKLNELGWAVRTGSHAHGGSPLHSAVHCVVVDLVVRVRVTKPGYTILLYILHITYLPLRGTSSVICSLHICHDRNDWNILLSAVCRHCRSVNNIVCQGDSEATAILIEPQKVQCAIRVCISNRHAYQ